VISGALSTIISSPLPHEPTDRGVSVPVSLSAGRETVRLFASVDTGAEFCLFERGFAEALLIELEQGTLTDFVTVAGTFRAWGHELTLAILGVEIHALVYFFENPEIRKNVLGRNGWLNRVRLGLVDYDSLVYLSGYDD
jgi:hypothetical protein